MVRDLCYISINFGIKRALYVRECVFEHQNSNRKAYKRLEKSVKFPNGVRYVKCNLWLLKYQIKNYNRSKERS